MTEPRFGDLVWRHRVAAGLTPDESAVQAALVAAARRRPGPAPDQDRTERPETLPVSPTPLIGRETETAVVAALLHEPAVRLLTLTGPGGTGKTRLALAVIERVATGFPDGVVFVPLASLGDPAFVPSAIAQRLHVREGPRQCLLDRLTARLADQRLLLVLDNFEHLLPAAPLIAELLGACPPLNVLVTSRAPLRLRVERELQVLPLALPNLVRLPPLEELAGIASVRLFAERAQAIKPDFSLTQANAEAVAAVCHRLDGLPLALELAAARSKVLPPAALLARLDRCLPLLTAGAQDLPDRQRTLRATIAWSHDLLTSEEQTLFRRLAVFVGGCTLEAAEATVKVGDDLGITIVDGIAALVDWNLLRAEETDGAARFVMLETVREFALEQLDASGEMAAVAGAHAEWCLTLAEQAAPWYLGPDEGTWLRRLDPEFANMRAAVSWAQGHDDAETRLRLGAALWRFMRLRGHMSEGRRWLEEGLAAGPVGPTVRIRALFAAGLLAYRQLDYPRAIVHFTEQLALATTIPDHSGTALALQLLGSCALDGGRSEEAIPLLEQAAAAQRELGDKPWLAAALSDLGVATYHLGDHQRAVALAEEALTLQREGQVCAHSLEALPFETLAAVARDAGQMRRAAELYHRSMQLWHKHGDTWHVADCLTNLADIAAAVGKPERATRLLAAAETVWEVLGAASRPRDRNLYDRALASARLRLAPDAFAEAWAAGTSLSLQEAIAEAAALAAGAALPASHPDAAPMALTSLDLTRREREVLLLIVDGATDRDIGAALSISPRTVGAHVSGILAKLGVETRRGARAYALRHGLAASLAPTPNPPA